MFAGIEPRLFFHFNQLTRRPVPRVVFLHIPKCGGTSINHHFKSNFGGKRTKRSVLLDSAVGNASCPNALDRARRAQFVGGHFGWNTLEHVRAGAITFTVLREPFDRLQALYEFARKPRQIAHPTFAKLAAAAARLDFPSFCLEEEPDVRAMTDNAIARTLAADYFPIDPTYPVNVEAACSHLDELDFVADVSRLSNALPMIAAATQTKVVQGRGWLNRTGSAGKTMSRRDFLADSDLSARISKDLDVYEHARERIL